MPPQYVVGIPSDESHYDSILPKRLLRKVKMSIGYMRNTIYALIIYNVCRD